MATTAPEPSAATPRMALRPASAPAPRKRRSRGWRWLLGLLFLAIAGGSAWAAATAFGLLSHEMVQIISTQKVKRQDMLITVTASGNVESAKNVDVRCQVAGGSTILWIIPDGSLVKQGDELVRLNSATIEDLMNQQKILYEKAQATRIDAEKMYSAAKLAVQEYIEGTFIKELQIVEASITVAQENLRSAENSLQHTERMARKGYVTPLQLDAAKFAVERAKLDLAAAQTSKNVLEKFTKPKLVGDLESARDSAEARMRSEQAASELELTRLKRLMTQLEQCTITAPQDGMVVYANEMTMSSRGSSSGIKIEEGAMVRERQSIVRLPDLSQMQVKGIVHESKVDSILPGMRANIELQDRSFQGEVTSVATQPEPTSWMNTSVKEYATIVRIDGHTSGLKPGMTAKVEILVADLKNVLSVPVQAVVEQGPNLFFCFVKKGQAVERRQVKIGQSNSTSVEIKQGLEENEDLVLNPAVSGTHDDTFDEEHVDVAGKFGKKTRTASKASPQPGKQPKETGARRAGEPQASDKRLASNQQPRPDIAQLDRDGDHKVSMEEAPERMREFFPLIDTNHDGSLDAAELAAARSRRPQSASHSPDGSGGQ